MTQLDLLPPPPDATEGPEIVVGLIGPIGVDMGMVCDALASALSTVDYRDVVIPVVDLLGRFGLGPPLPTAPIVERYNARISAGNDFRRRTELPSALILPAVVAIQEERRATTGDPERAASRVAYLLKSLKTPEEVGILRKIYGNNCVFIAAHAPHDQRSKNLADRIAASKFETSSSAHMPTALGLLLRDEREHGDKYGQNVLDAFHLADVFVDASSQSSLQDSSLRFVHAFFGHPVCTPTRAEYAMFVATGAELRSSSPGRQVGACITRAADGEVIAVGTNEVPKAFGGVYWEGDPRKLDNRDHTRPTDTNRQAMRAILADILERAQHHDWLAESLKAVDREKLAKEAEDKLLKALDRNDHPELAEGLYRKALLNDLIGFMRPVHAEMAALTSAARTGVSIDEALLYSTSFPCHECARHIVAAGIKRVTFVSPYPKSRAADFYSDSISIEDDRDTTKVPFVAFIGIAPRMYQRVFRMPDRLGSDGRWTDWEDIRRKAMPREEESPSAYLEREADWIDVLRVIRAKLFNPKPEASP